VKLAVTIAGSIKADMQAEVRRIERAVTAGVKEAGDGLKGSLRKQVVAAGLGPRLARTWRGRAYPNKGHDAASLVWSKAPQIVRVFDEGAVIRGKSGFWLASPRPRRRSAGSAASASLRPTSGNTVTDRCASSTGGARRRCWWWTACGRPIAARPASSGGSARRASGRDGPVAV